MNINPTDRQLKLAVDRAVRHHIDQQLIARNSFSHARFTLPRDSEGTLPCLIEPAVQCVHCGYCQSLGH